MRVLLSFVAVLALVHARFSFTGSNHLYDCTPCKCAGQNGPRLTHCRPMWTWDPNGKYNKNGLCLVADDGMYMFTSPGETCPEGSPQPPVPQDPKRVFGKRTFMHSECRSNTVFHSKIVRNDKGTNTVDKCAGWCDRQLWNGDQANACQFSGYYYDKHCKAIWSDVTHALGAKSNIRRSCSDGQSYQGGWKCQWGTAMIARDDRGKHTEEKCREMSDGKAYTWYHGNGQCYTYPNGIVTGTRSSTGQWNTNGNRDWVTCRLGHEGEAAEALNRAFRQGMGYSEMSMVETSTSVTLENVALYGFAALGCGFLLYRAGKYFSKAGDTVYAEV